MDVHLTVAVSDPAAQVTMTGAFGERLDHSVIDFATVADPQAEIVRTVVATHLALKAGGHRLVSTRLEGGVATAIAVLRDALAAAGVPGVTTADTAVPATVMAPGLGVDTGATTTPTRINPVQASHLAY